jgi:hypothetical protein
LTLPRNICHSTMGTETVWYGKKLFFFPFPYISFPSSISFIPPRPPGATRVGPPPPSPALTCPSPSPEQPPDARMAARMAAAGPSFLLSAVADAPPPHRGRCPSVRPSSPAPPPAPPHLYAASTSRDSGDSLPSPGSGLLLITSPRWLPPPPARVDPMKAAVVVVGLGGGGVGGCERVAPHAWPTRSCTSWCVRAFDPS